MLGGSQTVNLSDVAYVPELCFNIFVLKAAQIKGMMYAPHEDGSISVFLLLLELILDQPGLKKLAAKLSWVAVISKLGTTYFGNAGNPGFRQLSGHNKEGGEDRLWS